MTSVQTTSLADHSFDIELPSPGYASSTCFRHPGAATDTVRVDVMGRTEVDGVPVRSARPLEVVTALALAGGAMHKDGLSRRLYSDLSSPSAVPTQCYRARRLGIDIGHDAATGRYVLRNAVSVDAVRIARLLGEGRTREALCLWAGPCLPRSDSPLADSLRVRLESALVENVTADGDPGLVRAAARVVEDPALSERLDVGGLDLASEILSESHRRGVS